MDRTRRKKDQTFAEFFWSNVSRNGPIPPHSPDLGPCWEWMRTRYTDTYGKTTLNGKQVKAHRVAWLLTHGCLPASPLYVLHRCDNPPCCRPDHLFSGTNIQNIQDKMDKGRMKHGIEHHNAVFTEDQVRMIRILYRDGKHTLEGLAEQFHVSHVTIASIVHRKTWRHVR